MAEMMKLGHAMRRCEQAAGLCCRRFCLARNASSVDAFSLVGRSEEGRLFGFWWHKMSSVQFLDVLWDVSQVLMPVQSRSFPFFF